MTPVTHCSACSALYHGALEECPVDPAHHVRVLDWDSPDFVAFREVMQAQRRIEAEG